MNKVQFAQEEDEPEEARKETGGFDVLIKISQILMPIVLGALIPWGSWITYKTISFDEWRNIGPRFTPKDAESLELRIRNATCEYIDRRMSIFDGKFDGISKSIADLKEKLMEHEAKTMKSLKEIGGQNGQ